MAAVRLSHLQKPMVPWVAADGKADPQDEHAESPGAGGGAAQCQGPPPSPSPSLGDTGRARDDAHAWWENRKRLSDRSRSSKGPHTCRKL